MTEQGESASGRRVLRTGWLVMRGNPGGASGCRRIPDRGPDTLAPLIINNTTGRYFQLSSFPTTPSPLNPGLHTLRWT